MSNLRHCVVALSTTGEFIQHMDMRPNPQLRRVLYHERQVWTDSWALALEKAGALNDDLSKRDKPLWLHPNERRNAPSKMVGGFEVVSEEKPCASPKS